jgi:hypothetical protein
MRQQDPPGPRPPSGEAAFTALLIINQRGENAARASGNPRVCGRRFAGGRYRRFTGKKALTGKCRGSRSVAEANPATVTLAKKLARYPINGRRRSLREIAAELEKAGLLTSAGTRYGAAAVNRMIA